MSLPARPSPFRSAVLALAAVLLALFVAPASGLAAVELKGTFAGPIADNSVCTAEPRDPIYGNTAWNPAAPPSTSNAPAVEDIVRRNEAGAHADYCVAYRLTPFMSASRAPTAEYPADPATDPSIGDDQRRIVVDTPEGFAAAASAVPACSSADFGVGTTDVVNCPQSQVGDALVRVHVGLAAGLALPLVLGEAATGIFNLEAGPDEAARLGVVIDTGLLPPTKFIVRVVFTGGQQNRLRSIVETAPRTLVDGAGVEQQIYVESVGLRFWGTQAAHPEMTGTAFAETGTECGTSLTGNFTITTYGDTPAAPSPVTSDDTAAPHQLSGCDALEFRGDVDVTTAERSPATPTAAAVRLTLDQNPGTQNATALLQAARVTLPSGLEIGAQIGARDGSLATCSADAFRVDEQVAPACPATARIGSARIDSPLLQNPLLGDVFLGPQPAVGALPDLFISTAFAGATAPDAPRIKLAGETTVDDAGRITTTFRDNPQLRFSSLQLNFAGGPNALLTTPVGCLTSTGSATLTPFSGTAAIDDDSSITIDQECNVPGFMPSIAVAADDARAGVKSRTVIHMERPDRSPWIDKLAVSLPPGLLADLNGVPECPTWAALAASCDASTRIGTVNVAAGAGGSPYVVGGAMYLSQRVPGAVAGVVIIVRAKIGDIDLGNVVVPGRIDLRPTDAGLNFSADVPTRARGVGLNIRAINVALDRPGFALNPSACGPLPYSAVITSVGGTVGAPSNVARYSGCNALPFAPHVDAELSGQVKAGGHPNVHVTIRPRAGDVNMRGTKLTLPSGVSTDLRNLQVTCPQEQFAAGACAANTKVGWVNADVAITPERITGDVHLVKLPGQTLPGLGLEFKGRFAQRVLSTVKIEKSGRVTSDFSSIPDLPLRRLEVRIFGGEQGPIQIPPGESWCDARTKWSTLVTGHGGQRTRVREPLACAKQTTIRLSDRGGLSARLFDMDGRRLQSIKVTLPRGFSFDRSRARSSRYGFARMRGSASVRTKVTQRTFRVAARSRNARNVRIKLDGAAIKATRSARNERGRVTVNVRLAFTNGAVEHQRIRVRPR